MKLQSKPSINRGTEIRDRQADCRQLRARVFKLSEPLGSELGSPNSSGLDGKWINDAHKLGQLRILKRCVIFRKQTKAPGQQPRRDSWRSCFVRFTLRLSMMLSAIFAGTRGLSRLGSHPGDAVADS